MSRIMVYHTVANNEDEIKYSVMEFKKELAMPSIIVRFHDDDKDTFYADNNKWIFGEFRVALLNYLNRSMSQEDKKELEDLDWINEENAEDILEILDKAVELNYDKIE